MSVKRPISRREVTSTTIAPAPPAERSTDTIIAIAMVCVGIWLLTACDTEPSRLGRINAGPTAQVYFNNAALPDGRSGPVQRFEAQYAGKTYRGRMRRAGNSWVARLGGVPMNTASGIEFRIIANDQMVYQAYQSNVQFTSLDKSVRIDDCNVKVGWSGTLHQGSCRWSIR